ncbi:MAG TPA: hypothetical protein VGN12_28100 [Pirellulales bacterium]|jgi:hypothetical protein
MALTENGRWLVGGGCAVAAFALTFLVGRCDRDDDKDDRKNSEEVRLLIVGFRVENGRPALTVKNHSSSDPAIISEVTFDIYDRATLKRIEAKHPKPKEYMAGDDNTRNEVVFTKSTWSGDGNQYSFYMRPGVHVPPKKVNDFPLSIHMPLWSDDKFTGTVEIGYLVEKGGAYLTDYARKEGVTIRGDHFENRRRAPRK